MSAIEGSQREPVFVTGLLSWPPSVGPVCGEGPYLLGAQEASKRTLPASDTRCDLRHQGYLAATFLKGGSYGEEGTFGL